MDRELLLAVIAGFFLIGYGVYSYKMGFVHYRLKRIDRSEDPFFFEVLIVTILMTGAALLGYAATVI
ncbi:MAG: hypothetical protein JNL10_22450 [Verrucomicrobiales bacterium]|nr:hypothetical protein [Verrucomicrobiales bacterium]